MNAPSVDNRIEEFRRRKGWSQQRLADRLGIKYQQISRWERGETIPVVGWAIVLAHELNTTVEELFPLRD